jgi:hypothetical protein
MIRTGFCVILVIVAAIIIKAERDSRREMVSIAFSDFSHDFHGVRDPASDKVPTWGFMEEGDDNEDVEEGRDGGGDVQHAP